MKNLIKLVTVVFVCVLMSNSAKAQVSFDIDREVDFTKYKTYSFEGWRENSDKILTSIDKKRIWSCLFVDWNRFESFSNQGLL